MVESGQNSGASEGEALFASIELSPIASVVTDPRLRDNPIVAVNAAFCALTGYAREEAIGRNCRFLAGRDTDKAAQAVLRKAVAEHQPALTELLNYRKDGSPFTNAVMIAPVRGDNGRVAFFLGSQMDVGRGGTLAAPRRSRAEQLVGGLTPRQRQVLAQMTYGMRNKQIAALLGIDEKTVKMHRAAMLTRLGAASSADAVRIGVEAGLQLAEQSEG